MDALFFYPTIKSMKFFARKRGPLPLTQEQTLLVLCYTIAEAASKLQASCKQAAPAFPNKFAAQGNTTVLFQ
jgi:hypothetical protein